LATPFRIGLEVTGEFFADRAEEVTRIRRALKDPTRLLIYGKRRLGKSSAIRQATRRHEDEGGIVIWADLATATALQDLTNRIISAIPLRWMGIEEALRRFSVSVEARTDAAGDPTLAFAVAHRPAGLDRQRDELRAVFDTLDAIAAERGEVISVVLDEFQAIGNLAGDQGDWYLRDIIQTSDHLTFICAGSQTTLIDGYLSESGPFFNFFEILSLGPIDQEFLSTWIESRLETAGVAPSSGVGQLVVELSGSRTHDVMQLSIETYSTSVGSAGATQGHVLQAARNIVSANQDRFQTIWSNLTPSQQQALRAVALGVEELFSREVMGRYDLAPSTIRTALKGLRSKGVLSEDTTEWTIDDPFFQHWVLLCAMQDGKPQGPLACVDPL
jgi:uncharacterized protein